MKEIKDDTRRCKDIPCSWIGRVSIVKMTVLPKAIYKFSAVLIKLPVTLFTELESKILKFAFWYKRPWIDKAILENEKSGSIRLYYIATVIKTVWYWHKIKNKVNDAGRKSPETISCTCGHLIYDKWGKNIQWRKDSLFNKCFLES